MPDSGDVPFASLPDPARRPAGPRRARPGPASLQRQFAGVAVLIALVSVLLVGGIGQVLLRDALDESAREQAIAQADQLAARLALRLGRAVHALETVAASPAATRAVADPAWLDEALMPALAAIRDTLPEVRAIRVRAGDRQQRLGAPADPAGGTPPSGSTPEIGTWHEAGRGGLVVALPLGAPASRGGGAEPTPADGGAILAWLDLSLADAAGRDASVDGCADCGWGVHGGDGRLLVSVAPSGRALTRLTRPVTVTGARVPPIRLQMDIAVPADGQAGLLIRLRQAAAAIALLMLVSALALAMWTARRIAAPLRRLADVAARVAAAPERTHAPVRDRSSAEMGALSDAFGRMLDAVARHRLQLNERLQTREADLSRAVQRLASLEATLPDVPYSLAGDGSRFLELGTAIEALSGIRRDVLALDARNWFERVHPDDRARLRQAQTRLRPGTVAELTYRIRGRGGEPSWVRDRFRLVADPAAPEGRRIDGLLSDASRLAHAERARADAVDRLRLFEAAVAATGTGLAVLDCRARPIRIVSMNPAMRQLFALPDDDGWLVGGVDGRQLRSPSQRARVASAILRGLPLTIEGAALSRHDGQGFTADLSVTPLPDARGRRAHCVVAIDARDRQKAEANAAARAALAAASANVIEATARSNMAEAPASATERSRTGETA